MGTKVVGKLNDWEDGDCGGGDFMKLTEGSNIVRIVTKPYQFYSHYTADQSGASRNIRCALKDCPVCQKGEKASPRWFVGVIDRETGYPAILEISMQVFQGILVLKKKKSWGDPRAYDIDILRKKAGSQPLYVVTPEEKSPITDGEKTAIKDLLSKIDLAKISAAPTPDEVKKQLGIATEKTATVEDSTGSDDELGLDDDDFDFE